MRFGGMEKERGEKGIKKKKKNAVDLACVLL